MFAITKKRATVYEITEKLVVKSFYASSFREATRIGMKNMKNIMLVPE